MVNSATVKSLKEIKMKYGAKLFYIWLLLEHGHNKWVSFNTLESYCSRRHAFRLVKELEKHDMIESEKRVNRQKFIRAV